MASCYLLTCDTPVLLPRGLSSPLSSVILVATPLPLCLGRSLLLYSGFPRFFFFRGPTVSPGRGGRPFRTLSTPILSFSLSILTWSPPSCLLSGIGLAPRESSPYSHTTPCLFVSPCHPVTFFPPSLLTFPTIVFVYLARVFCILSDVAPSLSPSLLLRKIIRVRLVCLAPPSLLSPW